MLRKSDTETVQSKAQKPTYDDKDQYGHPKIPFRGYFDVDRCNQRRHWAEQFASCSLKHTGEWWRNEGEDDSCSCLNLKGNIENPIGLVKVPVGIAGPLLLFGDHISGYALCPFATTEGALVASTTRGATALMRSGGVYVKVVEQNQIRSPSFEFRNMQEVDVFLKWLEANTEALQKQVKLFSQHAELRKIDSTRLGRLLVLNFNYNTHDAAGQNMVTSSTWHLCKWILKMVEKELSSVKLTNFCIESALSGDKKVAHINLMRTRGLHVQAEAWIPNSILKSVLKVTPEGLLKTYEDLTAYSLQGGAIGFSTNVGNIVAGIFLATGQDVACVAEGSIAHLIVRGITKNEIEQKDQMRNSVTKKPSHLELNQQVDIEESHPGTPYGGVYVCISIPSLVLGSVGGGTSLATQKECLNLMGCYGKDGLFRFGEIIAGFALGLEISTLSSLASGHFATAHEKLGRNRPTHGLKNEHLSSQLFSNILGPNGELTKATAFPVETGNSILSELTKSEMSKKVGHFGFKISYKDKSGCKQLLQVVLKSKPTGIETCNMINKMAQGCGLNLAVLYEKHKAETGFKLCHIRELAITENPDLKPFMPKVYYTICDPRKDVYVIVMEYLTSDRFSLLNTADDISVWTTNHIKVVLRDMAKVHSLYLNKGEQLRLKPWIEHVDMVGLTPLWKELLQHAHSEFPQMWTAERVQLMEAAIAYLPQMVAELASAPITLIHNDCNPRNICLRKEPTTESMNHFQTTTPGRVPYSDPRIMCIYDWELATIGVPQHDLAEFLAFTIQPTTPFKERLELIEFYREHLEYYSGVQYPLDRFLRILDLVTLDFAVNRLLMYTMAHTYKDYLFLPRVIDSNFDFIADRLAQGTFPISHKAKAKL